MCIFAPQSLQKSKPDKGWISPSPLGRLTGAFSKIRCTVSKIAAADNRLMHIFCDVPLAPVYIVVMFIPEMLCSLEVDYIAAILLPCEDIGQGGFVPLAAVILVECLIFTGSPPSVFHIESGGWDLLLCQIYGDLVAVLPADKQTENQTDNLGGFLVDYPKSLLFGSFIYPYGASVAMGLPLAPLVLIPVFTFLLMSFAYHSDMILIKGANSNVSGFSLSIPLLTAIKRTLFRLNISIALPTWR